MGYCNEKKLLIIFELFKNLLYLCSTKCEGVVMVAKTDLKSVGSNPVRVRVPPLVQKGLYKKRPF
jgi:hypothetical protein